MGKSLQNIILSTTSASCKGDWWQHNIDREINFDSKIHNIVYEHIVVHMTIKSAATILKISLISLFGNKWLEIYFEFDPIFYG